MDLYFAVFSLATAAFLFLFTRSPQQFLRSKEALGEEKAKKVFRSLRITAYLLSAFGLLKFVLLLI